MGDRCYIRVYVRASDVEKVKAEGDACGGGFDHEYDGLSETCGTAVKLVDTEGYADDERIPAGVPFIMHHDAHAFAYGAGIIARDAAGKVAEATCTNESPRPLVSMLANGKPDQDELDYVRNDVMPVVRRAAKEIGLDLSELFGEDPVP